MARSVAVAAMSASALAADASPCAPAAHVTGDRDAVARVTAELVRLGVATTGQAPGCPAPIEAAVELAGSGVAVAIRDAGNRSEGRTVDNPTLAAEWIDSWLRDALDPWREQAAPRAAAVTVAATTPAAAPGLVEVHATAPELVPRASLLDRLSVGAGFEQTYTNDGTSWRGLTAAACVEVGGTCIGVRGHYATQSIAPAQTAADRRDIAVLATASTTWHVGTTRVSPEVGLGVGAMTTTRVDGCTPPPPACDPTTDPSCPPTPPPACFDANGSPSVPVYVGDHLDATTWTPRASVAVRIAVPLAPHVFLDGIAGATAMPFGHGNDYAAGNTPPGLTPAQVALPGDPAYALQLAVGLRVEGR